MRQRGSSGESNEVSRGIRHWARGVLLLFAVVLSSRPGSCEEKSTEAAAKIHDTVVFTLTKGHGALSATERARQASDALMRAVVVEGPVDTKVIPEGEALVVASGQVAIVKLYAEDAEAAGHVPLETYAAGVGSRVGAAISAEKKRSAIAGTVFSVSLLVFFGLIAVYVIRKVGDLADGIRKWMIDNPDRISALRVQSQEVLGPTALRGGLLVALILGRVVAQIGVLYVWLAFALSLFAATRPLTAKLAGFVFSPLSDLAGRVAASLPLAVVAAVSGVALYVLLRFVQLFFEGVGRRQTTIPWLPADLAGPTSILLRVGIVVMAFVFAAPIVTGDPEGALSRTGSVALLALGLASTPLLSTVVLGAVAVYGRRVRPGQFAEIGGRTGRVRAVGLFEVRLVETDGTETRVPHFLTLVRPTRILGDKSRLEIRISVVGSGKLREIGSLLSETAGTFGEESAAELRAVDGDGAVFAVSVTPAKDTTQSDLLMALTEALAKGGYALGRSVRGQS